MAVSVLNGLLKCIYTWLVTIVSKNSISKMTTIRVVAVVFEIFMNERSPLSVF